MVWNNCKTKINWKKVIFAFIGLLLVGGLASYFMFFKKADIVTSDESSNATESPVKPIDNGGGDNEDSGKDQGDGGNDVEAESEKSAFHLRVDSLRNGTMLCFTDECEKDNPLKGFAIIYANGIWKWDDNENGTPTTVVNYPDCLNKGYKDLKEAIDKLEAAEADVTPDQPVETAPVETAPVEPAPVEPAPVEPAAPSVYDDCITDQNILKKVIEDVNNIPPGPNEEREEKSMRAQFKALARDFLKKVKSLPEPQQSEFKSTVRDVEHFFVNYN